LGKTSTEGRHRIFIADDEAMQRLILFRHLDGDDREVVPFSGAKELLEAACGHPPDVVITDLMMPGMSGIELCRRLRALAATRRVPVLVISSRDGEEDIVEAFSTGANDYLIKPVKGPELRAKVRVYLEIARRARGARPPPLPMARTDRVVATMEEYGKFTIIRKLASGGMGAVYLAHQKDLDRQVALKVLKDTANDDDLAVKRFFREMRVLASIDHPHVVKVLDVGRIRGQYFLSMEYLEGQPLSKYAAADEPNQRYLCRLFSGVAGALGAIHDRGVIHRDVKPHNIFVADARPYLIDFGLACKLVDKALTRPGQAWGTPLYMAPEQVREGGRPDHRSDFYSLGMTIYSVLTGVHPFEHADDTIERVFFRHFNETPEPPSRVKPGLHRGWDAVVMKLLQKDPARRFAQADKIVQAFGRLETILDQARATSTSTPAPA